MSQLFKILPRRMPFASLPTYATAGELIITTDTDQMFVGKGPSVPIAQCGGGLAPSGLPNLVYATDPSGSATDFAALRYLVAADIPSLPYDASGAAAAALASAETYASGLAGNYDASGAAATALTSAKAYANSLASNYDASGAAATAQSNAETFATAAVASETSRAETAEGTLVPKTTTVNTHALSGNIILSASDLTTGTLPHAQLPSLVSADIPNNAANTSGSAASISGSQTANYFLAAPNGSAGAAAFRAIVAADIPTLNQNTSGSSASCTGNAAGLTGTPSISITNLTVGGTTSFVAGSIAYAALTGTPSIPTSFAWNVEGNATGNLTLANAAYTSTFNQTAAVAWLWANTTTGSGSSTNGSPLLELAANYYTGSASAQDLWTIGSSLLAGTNGASNLNITHTGTTGTQTVAIVGAGGNSTKFFVGAATEQSATGVIALGAAFFTNGTTYLAAIQQATNTMSLTARGACD